MAAGTLPVRASEIQHALTGGQAPSFSGPARPPASRKIGTGAMKWFNGNMLQAIAEAHSRRVLLLVFIEGDDLASQNMRATFDDAEVDKLLEVMGCVPIRLKANSNACRQFTLVYPVTAIPSTFFISSRGNLEASVVGFTDPLSFGDRVAALMAACNVKKVDSEMRNVSEASASVDRMARRRQSAARLSTAAQADAAVGGQPSLQVADPSQKRSKGEKRKKKLKKHEANVQTSIVVLAEQSTQINMDDKRSYNSLLQKLATMEEATAVPASAVQGVREIQEDLAADVLNLLENDGAKKTTCAPDDLPGAKLDKLLGLEKEGTVDPDDKIESSSDGESDDDPDAGGRSAGPKDKNVLSATMPPKPPPPPPPPPAAEAVRASDIQPCVATNNAMPAACDDGDSVLGEAFDGPAMLMKFAVLAQEFAEKVLSSSIYDLSDAKSPDASAQATKAPAESRKPSSATAKRQKQETAKPEVVQIKASGGQPKKEKRRHEDPPKRSCQLESLQTNVGDSPEAMATLREGAAEQATEITPSTKRKFSAGRPQRQSRHADPQQESKHGSEKRRTPRDAPTKDQAGDANKVAVGKKEAAPVAASTTRETGVGREQLAQKIKHFESAVETARKASLPEKKTKKPKGFSATPKSLHNDGATKKFENVTQVQSISGNALPMHLEPESTILQARPTIDTITEEDIGANDSCTPSPQPVHPATLPGLPAPTPPKAEAEPTQLSKRVEPATESANKVSERNRPQAPAPKVTTTTPFQAALAQRGDPQTQRTAKPSACHSFNKSKEFLTASNSQLDDGLPMFGATPRACDGNNNAGLNNVSLKSVQPAALRDGRGRGRVASGTSPAYERLRESDGDDETVDDELGTRRTPSLAAFRADVDWMDEMARTASRRALVNREGAEDSLNSVLRALNDVEGNTLSLSVTPDGGKETGNSAIKKVFTPPAKPEGTAQCGAGGGAEAPSTSCKQPVHVTINEHNEDSPEKRRSSMAGTGAAVRDKAGPIAKINPRLMHRVSVSGTSVRNRSRSRPSTGRVAGDGQAWGAAGADTRAYGSSYSPRRSASFTPSLVPSEGRRETTASIVLNLPDGSSVLHSFPATTYLDEVRWFTEELLARALPNCFPFTIARTNPLREFSREDYRKTLEQLHLAPSATLLVLPRSTAQGECGASALVAGDPTWLVLFRIVFGTFVATPISLIWGLLHRDTSSTREAFMTGGTLGSSTLSALPYAGGIAAANVGNGAGGSSLRPVSSSGALVLRRGGRSSRTENFDIF